MNVDVNQLFEELGKIPQVEAIALGGSRATGRNDEKSDYDVYVYVTDGIDEKERETILKKYCSYIIRYEKSQPCFTAIFLRSLSHERG